MDILSKGEGMKVTLFDLYNQKAQEVINKLSESDKTDVLIILTV